MMVMMMMINSNDDNHDVDGYNYDDVNDDENPK